MSTANQLALEIDQYATNNIQLKWIDPSTNLPRNLTGYSALMQIKTQPDNLDAVLELSTANGKIVLGGVLGTINITISHSDTDFTPPNSLPWYNGFYDLYLTNTGDSTVTKFSYGLITLLKGVTIVP